MKIGGTIAVGNAAINLSLWFCVDDHVAALFQNPAIGSVPLYIAIPLAILSGVGIIVRRDSELRKNEDRQRDGAT
jgi:hypothetical protein